MDNGQIILFQTQGGETKIEVRLSNETVWLTADQMAELFQRDRSTISRHTVSAMGNSGIERVPIFSGRNPFSRSLRGRKKAPMFPI